MVGGTIADHRILHPADLATLPGTGLSVTRERVISEDLSLYPPSISCTACGVVARIPTHHTRYGGLKAGATCAGSNSHRCSPNYQTSTPYESREIQPDVRSKPHSNVWDRLLGVQDERSRGTGMRLVVLAVLILTATTSPQINVTPNVFTTAFVGREQLHQSPLVVLRADTPVGGGASLPSELEIFSEDPNWNSKVEEFMVVTGANAHGIKNALKEVRHLAWAAGRTFQGRHVALLAFADDAYSDGDTTASCRLTRAVVAASRHVMDAHFILVADGFELDAAMRENVEGVLNDRKWRSLTVMEVPEFEGYSSVINRVMTTVPGNSMVAVLSTSVVLLPTSTSDNSIPATSESDEENVFGDATNGNGGEQTPRNIFVAYERMRTTSSVLPSSAALNSTHHSSGSPADATLGHHEHGRPGNAGTEGVRYNSHGPVRPRNNSCSQHKGLLVTASPSRWTTNPQRNHGDDGTTSLDENVVDHEIEETGRRRLATGWVHPPPAPRELPAVILSNVAPMPLLVFDTETFLALGELDERFAFQGGIAEWINRAEMEIGGQSRTSTGISGYCCNDSSCQRDGSPASECAAQDYGTARGSSCPADTVQHVHELEWGRRFVGSWRDDAASTDDVVQSSGFTAQSIPDARSPGVDPLGKFGQHGRAGERVLLREGSDGHGSSRQRCHEGPRTNDEIMIDQWNRLPAAKLEALVQADADYFFLPLLLLQQSPEDEPRACLSFHSEWMERGPHKDLMHGALARRQEFPVAAVVVVHDDVSLLRPALEAAAIVVEYILVVVSRTPWNGDAMDITPTVELLESMMQDVASTTYGKLRVDVGSWATERDQRNYGNAVISEDPRGFFRVVVMDANEFWHPVELAKALVTITRYPDAMIAQAEIDTYWASLRLAAFPSEMLNAVWLVDPRRCFWDEIREIVCDVALGKEHRASVFIARHVGVIRQLSHHEARQESEQLQLRPISGNLAVVDVNRSSDLPVPLWVTGATDETDFGSNVVGADAVWSRLLEATSSRLQCANPPCGKGKRIHAVWADLAEEMSHVQGAVVVRRPDLTKAPGMLAPANSLDFVKTLQSYFTVFKRSLFPIRMMIDGYRLTHVYRTRRFVKAVANGDSAAGRYLSSYYADVEVPKRASDGYENVPTLVGMADMFINKLGHVWNEKNYIVPKSCMAHDAGPRARPAFPTRAKSYEKVFIMTQFWGDQYFHFLVDALPRITLMLDVLRENLDIKMAIYAPGPNSELGMEYMCEFLELLGLGRNRVIFLDEEIHAALAILPSSTPCGKTDTQTINMLRQALLQALYPSRGRPPLPPRPLIVLVVRTSKRGLQNSNQVRDALKQEFPAYDVVEFLGTGPIVRQLHLFATASLIVAPHGAGLSNMIVSPLHTPVLEIGSLDCPTCFMELALKLHHVYARHPGSSTWTTPCGTQYEPHIGEILLLVRDLLEANRQADAADPPRRGGGVQHL